MKSKSTDWRALSSERLALSRITGKRIDRRHAPTPAEKRLLTINRSKIERFFSGDRMVTASFQKREKVRAKLANKAAEQLRRTFTKIANLGVPPIRSRAGGIKFFLPIRSRKKTSTPIWKA